MGMNFNAGSEYERCGKVAIVFSCALLFVLGAMLSFSFGQSPPGTREEWDGVEVGFVEFLARGDPSLRQPPAIQIVSPPVDLDYQDPEVIRRVLVETADTIPEWGPYFRPSRRTVREEFEAFLGSIDGPVRWPGGTQPVVPSDATAFGFSPDLATLAGKGAALSQPESVRWEVMANSGSKNTETSSKKIRIRIGPARLKGSLSEKQQEVNTQFAEGVFTFTGMSTVSIIPGRWFSAQLIDHLVRGPFKLGRGTEYWWGPTGRFAVYPKSLVIVSDPSFSLRLDARSYHEVSTALAGGASIGVGPFQVTSHSEKARVSLDEKSSTITVKQSSRAMIVAVINQVNTAP